MWKKPLATVSMLAGMFLVALEFAVLELSGVPGFLLAAGGVALFLEGAIVLCLLNRSRRRIWDAADAVDVGLGVFEVLLEFFFGA